MSTEPAFITQLTQLADSFGPFFFAVFFITLVSSKAYKWYSDALLRTPPDANQVGTCKYWFVCSVAVGLIFVFASVAYWFHQHLQKQYVYQLTITGIKNGMSVDANYYYRMSPEFTDPRASLKISDLIWDKYFLIVQSTPFAENQKFDLTVKLEGSIGSAEGNSIVKEVALPVLYKGQPSDTFRLSVDASGNPTLVAVQDTPHRRISIFDLSRAREVASSYNGAAKGALR